MPLYDILNEFQKGSSHMAAVVKVKGKSKNPQPTSEGEKFEGDKVTNGNSQLTVPLLTNHGDKSERVVVDIEKPPRPITNKQNVKKNDAATTILPALAEDIEDGEVIGIITLEDVFEELLQVSSASTTTYIISGLICLTFGRVAAQTHKKIYFVNACTYQSNLLI
jgi:metal transporter CNNM